MLTRQPPRSARTRGRRQADPPRGVRRQRPASTSNPSCPTATARPRTDTAQRGPDRQRARRRDAASTQLPQAFALTASPNAPCPDPQPPPARKPLCLKSASEGEPQMITSRPDHPSAPGAAR